MGVLQEIQEEVNEIASSRNMTDDKAFAYWFLEKIEDLSQEEAENAVVDGPWDGKRDAVYVDEENETLQIYQFKYSDDTAYARNGFTDLQEALINEESERGKNEFGKFKKIDLYLVTCAKANNEIRDAHKNARKEIRKWLSRNGYSLESDVILYDLTKFAELYEKIYGIDIILKFRTQPIKVDDALLGLLDATTLTRNVEREELFSFNIRKFLGMRKGSVSSQMMSTLKEDSMRAKFWSLNNGIVCLCTAYDSIPSNDKNSPDSWHFENFTIVNGAQTINSISRFLEENPTCDDPIWVVSKILKIEENNIEYAQKLTVSSNTQTPTSTRDLRAAGITPKRLKDLLSIHFNINYLYKRGDRAPKDQKVPMKDLSQAYVAYHLEQPHISFGYVAKIFASETYYDKIFPSDKIEELKEKGTDQEIKTFLKERLVPVYLLFDVRRFIKDAIQQQSIDTKWKSLTYHMLWVYKQILENWSTDLIFDKHEEIVKRSATLIFDGLRDACAFNQWEIPNDLKSDKLANDIQKKDILNKTSQFAKARQELQNLKSAVS